MLHLLFSGMHKHVFYTLVGLGIGEGGWKFKERVAAEKDVQYFHYMVLHPEDFRAPGTKADRKHK